MLDMLSLAHLSDHMQRLSGKRQDEESFYRENAGYPWAGLVRRLKGWFAVDTPEAPVASPAPMKPVAATEQAEARNEVKACNENNDPGRCLKLSSGGRRSC